MMSEHARKIGDNFVINLGTKASNKLCNQKRISFVYCYTS